MPFFQYGETEKSHLSGRDPALGAAISEIGHIEREVIPDMFTALVNSIVAQQISSRALDTIWNRMLTGLGVITPEIIASTSAEDIQKFGMTMKKATYIKRLADMVLSEELDINRLFHMTDDEICTKLKSLSGIGIWTAEMLMIFSMQRPDILSWNDLAIHRGLRMLYRHRKITKQLFNKYRRRYSPYATVAGLYLWAIAGGACDGLSDPAARTPAKRQKRTAAVAKQHCTIKKGDAPGNDLLKIHGERH